jgi:hypothetical protein
MEPPRPEIDVKWVLISWLEQEPRPIRITHSKEIYHIENDPKISLRLKKSSAKLFRSNCAFRDPLPSYLVPWRNITWSRSLDEPDSAMPAAAE